MQKRTVERKEETCSSRYGVSTIVICLLNIIVIIVIGEVKHGREHFNRCCRRDRIRFCNEITVQRSDGEFIRRRDLPIAGGLTSFAVRSAFVE